MKLSSREQLLKEAEQILQKLRQLRETKEVNFGKNANRYAKGYSGKDMMWKSETILSIKDAMEIMKQALPGGYNGFKAELIAKLPPDSKIQIAREYSVCLYVKTNTKPRMSSLQADELHEVSPGVYRIWWD